MAEIVRIKVKVEDHGKAMSQVIALKNNIDYINSHPINVKVDNANQLEQITRKMTAYNNSVARRVTAENQLRVEELRAQAALSKRETAEERTKQAIERTRQAEERTAQATERTRQAEERTAQTRERTTQITERQSAANTRLGGSMTGLVAQFVSLHMLLFRTVSAFRDALQTMKDVDSALVTIQKTTGYTGDQLDRLTNSAYELANAYGRTATEILNAASVYARAGFKDNLDQMTELSALLQNVGDLEGDVAAKFLIATNAAWKLNGSYDALMGVIDGLNAQTNQAAVDMEALTSGITVAGSVFSNAGESVQTFAGLLGAGVALTQRSGSEVARGLRTIAMNIRQIKGELDDGEIIDEASISDAAKALHSVGISVADANGELRLTSDVLDELARRWESLTTAEQSYLAQSLAGKRQANILNALMSNWEEAQRQMTLYANGAGSAMRENEIYLNSWEAKTKQLSAAWTKFVNNLVDSGAIKNSLDGLIRLVEVLDSGFGHFVITIGTAGVATAALGKAMTALKLPSMITWLTSYIAASKAAAAGSWAAESAMFFLRQEAQATFVALAHNPVVWVVGAVAAIYGLVEAYRALNPTAQELADKAAQAAENYKKLQAEIDQINAKIDENKKLITEANQLQDSDVYISRLQNENALLETQLGLLKAQADEARKQANRDAKRAFNAASYGWESGQEAYRVQGETYYRPTYTSGTPLEYARNLLERMRSGEDVSSEMSKVLGVLLDINESFDAGDEEAKKYSRQISVLVRDYNELNTAVQKAKDNLKNIGSSDPWAAWSAQAQVWGGLTEADVDRAKQWFDVAQHGAKDTETLYDELTRLSEQRKAEKEAIAGVSNALAEYGAYSKEAFDAMQALEKAIPGSTKNLYDFDTATLKVEEDTVNTEEALSNFVYGIKAVGNAAKDQLQYFSDLDSAIDAVSSAMSSNGAKSIELYNAMDKLNKVAPEVVSEMYDLETAEWLVDSAQFASKNSLLDFIDAANSTKLTSLINELENASAAALSLAASIALALPEGAANSQFLDAYRAENNPALQKLKQQKADWDSYVLGLRGRSDYKPSSPASTAKTSSASGSDTELEKLKNIVALRKQELDFLKESGAPDDEIISKHKEIQAALHNEAEYLRKSQAYIDGDEKALAEVKALSTEWWTVQKEITAIEEKQLALEEERLKTAQELFDTIKKTVDEYYDKAITDKEKELQLEEKILAVQEAQAALANAQKERNARYFNAASGQWEWGANPKNVKAAQDALKKAQDDLNKYQKEQAWKEFKDAWEYVSDQIKAGAITFQQAYNYMETKMREIQNKYNVDMGGVLRESIGGFQGVNKTIKDLDADTAAQLGASVGQIKAQNEALAAATGSAKDAVKEFKDAYDTVVAAVKSGDMSFDDAYAYLKQQAEIISAKYGTDMTGALDKAIEEMETIYQDLDSIKEAVKQGKITPENAFEIISKALDSVSQKYGQDITGKVNKILDEKGGFKDGIGGLAQAVKDGKISIDDAFGYLEDATSEVADEYGINMTDELNTAIQKMGKSGEALDDLWKTIVLNKMRMNSVSWLELDEQKKKAQASGDTALAKAIGEQQDQLHAENEALGKTIGATYDKSGHWSLNGSTLYDPAADRASGAFSGVGGGGGGVGGADAVGIKLSDKMAEAHYIPGYGYVNVGQAIADMYNVQGGATGNALMRQLILREGTEAEAAEYLSTGKIPQSFADRYNSQLHNIVYSGADTAQNFTGSFNSKGQYTGTAIVYKGSAHGQEVQVVNGQLVASGLGDTGSNILLTPDGQVLRVGANNTTTVSGETWSNSHPYDLAVLSLLQRTLLELGQSGKYTPEELYGKMYGATYDSGGVLHGVGGIKATARDEMVLPPDITERLLTPANDAFVQGRMNFLRSIVGMPTQFAGGSMSKIGAQYNGDIANYTMNGVTISEGQARTTTVYELAQMARSLGAYQRS